MAASSDDRLSRDFLVPGSIIFVLNRLIERYMSTLRFSISLAASSRVLRPSITSEIVLTAFSSGNLAIFPNFSLISLFASDIFPVFIMSETASLKLGIFFLIFLRLWFLCNSS